MENTLTQYNILKNKHEIQSNSFKVQGHSSLIMLQKYSLK